MYMQVDKVRSMSLHHPVAFLQTPHVVVVIFQQLWMNLPDLHPAIRSLS
jgi:hypothetical protein